jgi:hypothetical protein
MDKIRVSLRQGVDLPVAMVSPSPTSPSRHPLAVAVCRSAHGIKREHVDGQQTRMYPRVPRPCVLLSAEGAAGGGMGGGGAVGSRLK